MWVQLLCIDPGGCYLGFSKSANFRVWIPAEILSLSVLKGIEQSSSSASELAMSLFTRLFKDDIETRPDDICATDNRLNGREMCNPEFIRGICCKFCTCVLLYNNSPMILYLQYMLLVSIWMASLKDQLKLKDGEKF